MTILPNHLKLSEHVRQSYSVSPASGTKPADLLDPKFWVHVGPRLRPGDKIEAMPETSAWYAELIVISAGRFGAKVAFTVQPVDLAAEAAEGYQDEFEVKWAGPSVKFRVVRLKDNSVIRDGFQTKDEGETWLKSHIKAMAA